MAFPTIPTGGRVVTGVQANTTATRTFPNLSGLTKNSGDLLIAIVIAYQTTATANAAFSGWSSGWTEFVDQSSSTTMAIGAAYKWSDGTETGTISVTQAATITGQAVFILLSIPGAHATTPPEGGTIANGTTTVANAGALDPAGWAAEDALWIAVAGVGRTSTSGTFTGVTGAPTNYSGLVSTGTSGGGAIGDTWGGVAFRQLNASSEDVGAFTTDTSNARNSELMIAVRPAPGQSVTLTPATETNTAGSLQQAHHLTAATEADAAQSLTTVKTIFVTLTPATEADAAQTLSITHNSPQSVTLTPATGANTAQALTFAKATTLTPATGTNVAQALDVDKQSTLTPAAETDAAQTLTALKPIYVTLTPAAETDSAQGISLAGAAFPVVTTVSDDFNRANETPLSSAAGWAQYDVDGNTASTSLLGVFGNIAAAASNSVCGQVWAATLDPDVEAYVTLPLSPTEDGRRLVSIYHRLTSIGSGTTNGYLLTIVNVSGTDTWQINKMVAGNENNTVLASGTQEVGANDKVGFRVEGSNFSAYHYTSGAWNPTPIITATDSTFTSGGQSALTIEGNATALEDWTVGALTAPISVDLTPSTETDAAQTLTAAKQVTLTPATETDAAQTLTVTKPIFVTLTPATETDTASAPSLGAPQHVTLTPATETDSARSLQQVHSLRTATETDAAQTLSITGGAGPQHVTLTPATGTNVAQALDVDKHVTLSVAGPIIGPPPLFDFFQTDTAMPLSITTGGGGVHNVTLIPATETDAAQALSVTKPIRSTLTPAAETDSLVALTFNKAKTLAPAVETGAAQALNVDKAKTLTPATSVNSGVALVFKKGVTFSPALETDAARPLDLPSHAPYTHFPPPLAGVVVEESRFGGVVEVPGGGVIAITAGHGLNVLTPAAGSVVEISDDGIVADPADGGV